jgi:anoctamin-10/anoctamin-7
MLYRYAILEIVAFFAVLSNSAIVAFTGNYTEDYTWVVRVWIFVSMAAGILGIKTLIAAIVPDVPHEVTIQLKRAEYLTDKFFNDILDEDDIELSQTVASNVDYCVKVTDDDPL